MNSEYQTPIQTLINGPAHEISIQLHRRAVKAQTSMRIRIVSPGISLLAYILYLAANQTGYTSKGFAHIRGGIWNVLSMVIYLSNRFTNPIMFGTILKSRPFTTLWHKFQEDIIMQTGKILL